MFKSHRLLALHPVSQPRKRSRPWTIAPSDTPTLLVPDQSASCFRETDYCPEPAVIREKLPKFESSELYKANVDADHI
jgi:hypothetical protein